MKRQHGVAFIAVFLIVGAWAALRSSEPRPRCLATVELAGIVGDASGVRQATLLISNAGRHAIFLHPLFGLENRSGQWRTNLIPGGAMLQNRNLMGVLPFHPRSKLLRVGEVYEAKLPLPFDDSSWQASFWYLEKNSKLTGLLDKLSTILGRSNQQDAPHIAFTKWTN